MNIKQLKTLAESKNKKLFYNRSAAAYQITSGFQSSDFVYPTRNEQGKIQMTNQEIKKLKSFI